MSFRASGRSLSISGNPLPRFRSLRCATNARIVELPTNLLCPRKNPASGGPRLGSTAEAGKLSPTVVEGSGSDQWAHTCEKRLFVVLQNIFTGQPCSFCQPHPGV